MTEFLSVRETHDHITSGTLPFIKMHRADISKQLGTKQWVYYPLAEYRTTDYLHSALWVIMRGVQVIENVSQDRYASASRD